MRFLLIFILGLVAFFYLSALVKQVFKIKIHSLVGFIVGLLGIINIFVPLVPSPTNLLLSSFLIGAGLGIVAYHLFSESYIVSERLEKQFVLKHETAFERFLEILPGALTWLALTSPIWLSFTLPFAVAYIIVLANVYWLFSALRISILVYIGYHRMEQAKKIDWQKKLLEDFPSEWEKYYHLFLIPTYKESAEILAPTFAAIASSSIPKEKIFLAVGFEERDDPEKIAETTKYLEEKIAPQIGGVFTTIHPFGLPGEVPGPGTNRNFMVKNVLSELKKRSLDTQDVIATTLDADFIIHPQFLAGMLHKYLSTGLEVRNKRSFTGVFLYNNNYWQAPTPMRVIATGTAFWQLSEMVGSDKYINFASLSMNLKSLVETGLWLPNKVNDDAGFYWKAYYHFNGDYKVIPHFLPISADTVLDVSLFKTFQNQYLQIKRWAYGVEHIPFIFKKFFTNKNINFWDKIDKLTFIVWSYFKWGTLALFITFGGLFIPLINPGYGQSVVSHNLTVVSSWILTAAFVGLFTTIYFNEKVAPPRPTNWSILRRFWSYLQWVLVPIVLVSITSIPAIDAQTSLMFGRYLEFRVTNKERQATL
ncbi:MAG: glycosyltransferase family 2 protein [Candidatus Daviesbacteria bacterium]|nr:MAG: glycosyltransferase family 2 protein [Candidatus Daviesbacteria bacterium]